MEEYEPSSPGEDIPMSEPDSESMPMDISSLASRLTPPPEDLIRRQCTSGVISPSFFSKDSQSITSESFQLCGEKIYLINPLSGLSEDGCTWFDADRVKSSRITELTAMDRLEVGTLLHQPEATSLAAEYQIAIVPSRWLLTSKTINGVPEQCRARCVAQQVASGASSASNLGISSSTPSSESFRAFLALVAYHDMVLAALDISTAFLHSSLPKGHKAIIKLPSDVSWEPDCCKAVYINLAKAMNGLRIASKAWLQTCSRILQDNANLICCPSEPTIMAGVTRKSSCPVVSMTYVDGLLIGALSSKGVDDVRECLEETLKVKQSNLWIWIL